MNATEKKTTTVPDKKSDSAEATHSSNDVPLISSAPGPAESTADTFRDAIKALDAQRTELVKNAIDNIKPGRTFDSGVVRQINKLETMRNRLIIAHFAWLLKNSAPDVHAIVHQIIEL